MQDILEQTIGRIEKYALKHQLNHRFVGGVSFGGLLNKHTTYDISIKDKKILLYHHNPLTVIRNDKSIRDIDLIYFSEDKEKKQQFEQFISELEKSSQVFPDISAEPAVYTTISKRNHLFQFLTAYEVVADTLFLTFDVISQKITWQSVEPWTVVLENGLYYTVRNPIADYYAYLFRSPAGLKPKDKEKIIFLKKLADTVIAEGKKQKINYQSLEYYLPWQQYMKKLKQTKNIRAKAKIYFMKIYWQTIGKYLAHSKMVVLTNNFTGTK